MTLSASCSTPTLRPLAAMSKPCSGSSDRGIGHATALGRRNVLVGSRVATSRRTLHLVSGLPPFQSEAEQDVDEMAALLSVTREYPVATAQPPSTATADVYRTSSTAGSTTATTEGTAPVAAEGMGGGSSTTAKVTMSRSANAVDLFERAAAPMGKFERAEAALAAARAIQSPGIIKVAPGSTVRREQPKGDESVRDANVSLETAAAPQNFAKPIAVRRAEEELRKANDPTARLKAVAKANSEENLARERMVKLERERNAKKYQNASSFYGGGGLDNASSMFASKGGSFSDALNGEDGDSKKASNFWDWSPPEQEGGSLGSPYYTPPEPRRQKAPEYTRRVEAAVTTMERVPEQTLDLAYQSEGNVVEVAVETSEVSTASPIVANLTFQSEVAGSMEVEQLTEAAAPKQPAKVERAPAVEASLEDALTSAVRELGAEDGAKEGTLGNGARWWREEGKEALEDGKVMSWTVIRGTSADGAVEWEEKFWETSDAYTYRELGAVKSGRDSLGQAWQESWKEIYQHDVNGTPFIHREASKWSHTPKGQCWSEGWTEDYRADGSVERYCEKTGSLEDGSAPDDGHANRWTEKWGEKWDGRGSCIKWTDTWASRDHAEGGAPGAPGRSWGEKWEEKWGVAYNEDGRAGARQGVTWDEIAGGHSEKTWGEEHYPDGRMHKYGNSSDGSQYWDEWQDGDGGWWEVMPSFGWHEAIGHSPYLMEVPLQPRKGGGAGAAKGKGNVSIITPHRGSRRRVE